MELVGGRSAWCVPIAPRVRFNEEEMLPFEVWGTGADSKKLVNKIDRQIVSQASEPVPACQDVSDFLCSSPCRLSTSPPGGGLPKTRPCVYCVGLTSATGLFYLALELSCGLTKLSRNLL